MKQEDAKRGEMKESENGEEKRYTMIEESIKCKSR